MRLQNPLECQHPKPVLCMRRRQRGCAKELSDRAPSTRKESRFQRCARDGLKNESKGRWSQAVRCYEKALATVHTEYLPVQRASQSAMVKFRIGVCLKKDGKWSDALRTQHEVASIFSREGMPYWKAEAYFQVSDLYQMMNIYEPALMYYREAYFQYECASNTRIETLRTSAQRGMAELKGTWRIGIPVESARRSLGASDRSREITPRAS